MKMNKIEDTNIVSPRNCRLLFASRLSYAIQKDGSFDNTAGPLEQAVGFINTPKTFVGGLDNINAGLVGTNSDGVILAFRGTIPPDISSLQSWLDWINDIFMVEPIAVEGITGKVHEGFWLSLESIWAPILAEVKKQMNAQNPPLPLFITGHSKGGPLASFAAIRAKLEAGINPEVVTFASPHPGDMDFSGFYNSNIPSDTRYEFGNDAVPHLPPGKAFLEVLSNIPLVGKFFQEAADWNYGPVGTLQFIEWDKTTIVGDSLELEAERFLKLTEAIVELKFEEIVDDHTIGCGGGYISGVCPGVPCTDQS
jgi:hypothetical protein